MLPLIEANTVIDVINNETTESASWSSRSSMASHDYPQRCTLINIMKYVRTYVIHAIFH